MEKSNFIKVKIDDIEKNDNEVLWNDFKPHLTKIGEEKRKDRKDIITHIIAGTIVLTFLFLVFIEIIYNKIMPNYFLSIVSMIVGFYFAKELKTTY